MSTSKKIQNYHKMLFWSSINLNEIEENSESEKMDSVLDISFP